MLLHLFPNKLPLFCNYPCVSVQLIVKRQMNLAMSVFALWTHIYNCRVAPDTCLLQINKERTWNLSDCSCPNSSFKSLISCKFGFSVQKEHILSRGEATRHGKHMYEQDGILLLHSLSQKGYKWGSRIQEGIWGERTNIEGQPGKSHTKTCDYRCFIKCIIIHK